MQKEEISSLIKNNLCYPVEIEVESKFAMFSREDSGSEKTSYPVPTLSASKGIFESILYMPSVVVIPYKVQICRPINYYRFVFNYRGSLRKSNLIKDDNAKQIKYNILVDVCYRLFAFVINNKECILSEKGKKWNGINHAHSYQSQFNKRILRGKNNSVPFMGISEFITSYAGDFRKDTEVQKDINITLPFMTLFCFDNMCNGKWSPSYSQNVEIINGELVYVK